MRETSTFTLQDHQRMASAFLALTDDLSPEALQRSLVKVAAAFAAAFVLALAVPMTWLMPTPALTPSKLGDPPAATLGNSKAALAAADDEDADGGG
jgi:hypothetical protein